MWIRISIHENVCLFWCHLDPELSILREAGIRTERDGGNDGHDEVYESSHLLLS